MNKLNMAAGGDGKQRPAPARKAPPPPPKKK